MRICDAHSLSYKQKLLYLFTSLASFRCINLYIPSSNKALSRQSWSVCPLCGWNNFQIVGVCVCSREISYPFIIYTRTTSCLSIDQCLNL